MLERTLCDSAFRSSGECEHPVLCMSLQSARAREFTLELGLVSHARVGVERPLSVNFMHLVLLPCFTVRSSEGSHARAELFCLHVRSSVESHARARPLFSENFEKCFKVHLCILIPS